MARYIPIQCAEIDAAAGNPRRGVHTQLSFVLPQFGAQITAEFIPSQTKAAIKRAMKLVDLAIGGATKEDLTGSLEKFLKPSKRSETEYLAAEKLDEFMADNGWTTLNEIAEDEIVAAGAEDMSKIVGALVEDEPARRNGEELEEYWDRTIGPRGAVVTSDGRYIVDPAARTVSPVEDMPGDIVAVMPVWEIKDREISFWPRTFDIPAGMDETFKYEEIAARLLLSEIAHIMWGASDDELMFTSEGEYSIGLVPSGQRA